MGLELVGRGQGQGTSDAHQQAAGEGGLDEKLAEVERLVAASRQRLQALADRAAELRRRVGTGGGGSSGEGVTPIPSA